MEYLIKILFLLDSSTHIWFKAGGQIKSKGWIQQFKHNFYWHRWFASTFFCDILSSKLTGATTVRKWTSRKRQRSVSIRALSYAICVFVKKKSITVQYIQPKYTSHSRCHWRPSVRWHWTLGRDSWDRHRRWMENHLWPRLWWRRGGRHL